MTPPPKPKLRARIGDRWLPIRRIVSRQPDLGIVLVDHHANTPEAGPTAPNIEAKLLREIQDTVWDEELDDRERVEVVQDLLHEHFGGSPSPAPAPTSERETRQ